MAAARSPDWRTFASIRACVQESIRLWPAAPTLVRRTTTDTEWHGTSVPAGARVLIPAAVFHRSRRLPYANRLAPEIWLDGSGNSDWSLNLFSRGEAQCAGRNLALMLATASLAELLRQAEFVLLKPKLSPDHPLPYAIKPADHPVRGHEAALAGPIDTDGRIR